MSERNIQTREGYDFWDKLCAIPRYGFVIGPKGGVVKVEKLGSWIDRDEAQAVMGDAQSEVNELRTANQRLEGEVARLRETLRECLDLAETFCPFEGDTVRKARAALRGNGGDV